MLNSLGVLIEKARKKPAVRVIVSSAEDEQALIAIKNAIDLQFVIPIFIGNKHNICRLCNKIKFPIERFTVIDKPEPPEAAFTAVQMIKEGNGEILMKGKVPTVTLLREVVNKKYGLPGIQLLSHFALMEARSYHKLIGITDAAMNISPNLQEKVSIVQNGINVFHKLGVKNPKVAIVCPIEKENPKIVSTIHASRLKSMNVEGQITGCTIDGPLALDIAISPGAAKNKGFTSEVAGDADLLVAHNLDSGNILYKSIVFFAGGLSAAVITGAKIPIVLTSRSDPNQNKLFSLALGATLA